LHIILRVLEAGRIHASQAEAPHIDHSIGPQLFNVDVPGQVLQVTLKLGDEALKARMVHYQLIDNVVVTRDYVDVMNQQAVELKGEFLGGYLETERRQSRLGLERDSTALWIGEKNILEPEVPGVYNEVNSSFFSPRVDRIDGPMQRGAVINRLPVRFGSLRLPAVIEDVGVG